MYLMELLADIVYLWFLNAHYISAAFPELRAFLLLKWEFIYQIKI